MNQPHSATCLVFFFAGAVGVRYLCDHFPFAAADHRLVELFYFDKFVPIIDTNQDFPEKKLSEMCATLHAIKT
jgi:hypothetical protein